jgi:hypothetical protein
MNMWRLPWHSSAHPKCSVDPQNNQVLSANQTSKMLMWGWFSSWTKMDKELISPMISNQTWRKLLKNSKSTQIKVTTTLCTTTVHHRSAAIETQQHSQGSNLTPILSACQIPIVLGISSLTVLESYLSQTRCTYTCQISTYTNLVISYLQFQELGAFLCVVEQVHRL